VSGLRALTDSGVMRPPCRSCAAALSENGGDMAWVSDEVYVANTSVADRGAYARRGEAVACPNGGMHLRATAGREVWARMGAESA
jgi:hypothetical protein